MMEWKKFLRPAIIFTVVLLNIVCDQITKSFVRRHVDYYEKIELIQNHFTLTKIENSGAFLSLGDDWPPFAKNILLSLIPSAAILFGLFFVFSNKNINKNLLMGLCFVIGGGIGNLYDRMVYGSVTDFLHIDFGILRTGIFNMADVSIMIGGFLIILNSIHRHFTPEPAINEEETLTKEEETLKNEEGTGAMNNE